MKAVKPKKEGAVKPKKERVARPKKEAAPKVEDDAVSSPEDSTTTERYKVSEVELLEFIEAIRSRYHRNVEEGVHPNGLLAFVLHGDSSSMIGRGTASQEEGFTAAMVILKSVGITEQELAAYFMAQSILGASEEPWSKGCERNGVH